MQRFILFREELGKLCWEIFLCACFWGFLLRLHRELLEVFLGQLHTRQVLRRRRGYGIFSCVEAEDYASLALQFYLSVWWYLSSFFLVAATFYSSVDGWYNSVGCEEKNV